MRAFMSNRVERHMLEFQPRAKGGAQGTVHFQSLANQQLMQRQPGWLSLQKLLIGQR